MFGPVHKPRTQSSISISLPPYFKSLPPRSLKGHTVLRLQPLLPPLIPSLSIQELLKASALGIKNQLLIRNWDLHNINLFSFNSAKKQCHDGHTTSCNTNSSEFTKLEIWNFFA